MNAVPDLDDVAEAEPEANVAVMCEHSETKEMRGSDGCASGCKDALDFVSHGGGEGHDGVGGESRQGGLERVVSGESVASTGIDEVADDRYEFRPFLHTFHM
ncbi:hypothetical protein QEV63_06760 [Trueperella pyogenes]